jgi:hypothetical protein
MTLVSSWTKGGFECVDQSNDGSHLTSITYAIREVSMPSDSALPSSFGVSDFADAYEVPLSRPDLTVEQAYWGVFGEVPTWVRCLMILRGCIALRLGLAHSFREPAMSHEGVPIFEPGIRVGQFLVQSISEQELIVGNDDQHLNFRISALKTEREGRTFLTISTAVKIHNNLGRLYMCVVKPFHRFVAPHMVRRALRLGRL